MESTLLNDTDFADRIRLLDAFDRARAGKATPPPARQGGATLKEKVEELKREFTHLTDRLKGRDSSRCRRKGKRSFSNSTVLSGQSARSRARRAALRKSKPSPAPTPPRRSSSVPQKSPSGYSTAGSSLGPTGSSGDSAVRRANPARNSMAFTRKEPTGRGVGHPLPGRHGGAPHDKGRRAESRQQRPAARHPTPNNSPPPSARRPPSRRLQVHSGWKREPTYIHTQKSLAVRVERLEKEMTEQKNWRHMVDKELEKKEQKQRKMAEQVLSLAREASEIVCEQERVRRQLEALEELRAQEEEPPRRKPERRTHSPLKDSWRSSSFMLDTDSDPAESISSHDVSALIADRHKKAPHGLDVRALKRVYGWMN